MVPDEQTNPQQQLLDCVLIEGFLFGETRGCLLQPYKECLNGALDFMDLLRKVEQIPRPVDKCPLGLLIPTWGICILKWHEI